LDDDAAGSLMAVLCVSTAQLCHCSTMTSWTTASTRQSSDHHRHLTAADWTTADQPPTTASHTAEQYSSTRTSTSVESAPSSFVSPATVAVMASYCTRTSTPLYCWNTT